MEIRADDGRMWREFVYAPQGDPDTMLSPEQLRAEFSSLVRGALGSGRALCSFAGGRQCPKQHGDCPHARLAADDRRARVKEVA